jgi:hypothetical protein
MPFKDGKYLHKRGFTLIIHNGIIMLSPNHPLSLRLSELFDSSMWEEVID